MVLISKDREIPWRFVSLPEWCWCIVQDFSCVRITENSWKVEFSSCFSGKIMWISMVDCQAWSTAKVLDSMSKNLSYSPESSAICCVFLGGWLGGRWGVQMNAQQKKKQSHNQKAMFENPTNWGLSLQFHHGSVRRNPQYLGIMWQPSAEAADLGFSG